MMKIRWMMLVVLMGAVCVSAANQDPIYWGGLEDQTWSPSNAFEYEFEAENPGDPEIKSILDRYNLPGLPGYVILKPMS